MTPTVYQSKSSYRVRSKLSFLVILLSLFSCGLYGQNNQEQPQQTNVSSNTTEIDNLEQAIKTNPTADLYYRLSQEYAAIKKPKQALEAINKAVQMDPNNPSYLKNRGVIASWLDDLTTMEDSYSRLLKIDPNNTDAILGLARAYSRQGNYGQSSSYYEKYLNKRPKDEKAYAEYIQVLIWHDKIGNAKAELKKFKALFGQTEEYKRLSAKLELDIPKPAVKVSKPKVVVTKKVTAPANTIASVKRRVKTQPNNAKLYKQLSDLYSGKDQPQQALVAINKAVVLQPNNIEYLRSRANIAYWVDNIPVMKDSNLRILQLKPNDPDALLGMARAESRVGYYYQAAEYYHRYLALRPKNKKAWLEYTNVEIWQENYVKAMQHLSSYLSLFGKDDDYWSHMARVYAEASWFQSSLDINLPLLAKKPNDYYYNTTNTLAYRNGNQPAKALASLEKLNELQPNSEETQFMNPYVKIPLSSNINIGGNFLRDSQTVKLWNALVFGQIFLNPNTYIVFDGLKENISARPFSGLSPVNGLNTTYDDSGKGGLYHRFNEHLSLGGEIGGLSIHKLRNYAIYKGVVDLLVNERFNINYIYSRDLFRPDQFVVFSPRSVSLGIMQRANMVNVFIEPWLQKYLRVYGDYTTLSDGNSTWEVIVSPSMAVIRRNGLKIDLGASGDLYAFSKQLNNGYYSPKLAQLYLATMNLYYGPNFDTGISIDGGAGVVRDNTFNFHFAADISASLVYGIYSNWQVALKAGYSYRGNPFSPYNIRTVGVVLTHRC